MKDLLWKDMVVWGRAGRRQLKLTLRSSQVVSLQLYINICSPSKSPIPSSMPNPIIPKFTFVTVLLILVGTALGQPSVLSTHPSHCLHDCLQVTRTTGSTPTMSFSRQSELIHQRNSRVAPSPAMQRPLQSRRDGVRAIYSCRASAHSFVGVTNSKDVRAPSGDPHDYLSWAP